MPRSIELDDVGAMILDNAAQWRLVLGADEAIVRVRTRPDRWSTLEYAAHVRDVYRLYEQRLRLMLDNDDPMFPNWDQDETAVAERYDRTGPGGRRRRTGGRGEDPGRHRSTTSAVTTGGVRDGAATVPGSRSRRSPGT